VVADYTVSYTMTLITGARMGDLYGRRQMFLTDVLVFTVASLICGIAPGIGILIAARFVQGAGAAAMMPQIMSVIQVRFSGAARAGLGPGPGGVRARAGVTFGWLAAAMALGAAAGIPLARTVAAARAPA
jgi:MFS family permease